MSQHGLRFDSGKLDIGLIPVPAILELAYVFTKGGIKYAVNNWRLGIQWMRILTPMKRHLAKFELGQSRDPENNCHHLLQVAWGCVVLYMYERWAMNDPKSIHAVNDDRPDKMSDEEIESLFEVDLTQTEMEYLNEKLTFH